MRRFKLMALVPAAAAIWSGAAQAGSVQTLSFSGVIESFPGSAQPPFIDKYGLFGPAGADLTGATIHIFEQYAPAAFGPEKSCGGGTTCEYYNVKTVSRDIYGAILIVVTINGVQHAYSSAANSSIRFGQVVGSNEYISELNPVEFNGDTASVYLQFPASTSFEAPFPVTSVGSSTPLLGTALLPAGKDTAEDFPYQAVKVTH